MLYPGIDAGHVCDGYFRTIYLSAIVLGQAYARSLYVSSSRNIYCSIVERMYEHQAFLEVLRLFKNYGPFIPIHPDLEKMCPILSDLFRTKMVFEGSNISSNIPVVIAVIVYLMAVSSDKKEASHFFINDFAVWKRQYFDNPKIKDLKSKNQFFLTRKKNVDFRHTFEMDLFIATDVDLLHFCKQIYGNHSAEELEKEIPAKLGDFQTTPSQSKLPNAVRYAILDQPAQGRVKVFQSFSQIVDGLCVRHKNILSDSTMKMAEDYASQFDFKKNGFDLYKSPLPTMRQYFNDKSETRQFALYKSEGTAPRTPASQPDDTAAGTSSAPAGGATGSTGTTTAAKLPSDKGKKKPSFERMVKNCLSLSSAETQLLKLYETVPPKKPAKDKDSENVKQKKLCREAALEHLSELLCSKLATVEGLLVASQLGRDSLAEKPIKQRVSDRLFKSGVTGVGSGSIKYYLSGMYQSLYAMAVQHEPMDRDCFVPFILSKSSKNAMMKHTEKGPIDGSYEAYLASRGNMRHFLNLAKEKADAGAEAGDEADSEEVDIDEGGSSETDDQESEEEEQSEEEDETLPEISKKRFGGLP